MSIKNLNNLFDPKKIAVIGADENKKSIGYYVFRNLIGKGFKGIVYPVNPLCEGVQGVEAYKNINAIPYPIDLAILTCAPENLYAALDECGQKNVKGVLILTPDFEYRIKDPHILSHDIRKLASIYGYRVLGPNSFGFLRPDKNLNAGLFPAIPQKGNIAFISQSGVFSSAFLERAIVKNVGFSYFISLGAKLDINFSDLIDFLGVDLHTRAIILHVQQIRNGRRFMAAIRSFASRKPIVVVKSDKFDLSTPGAVSHSGFLAGEDKVYEAAFKRAGAVRVDDMVDLIYMIETLAKQHRPKGKHLAVISNAAVPSQIAVDTLAKMGGELALLENTTLENIGSHLSNKRQIENPIHLLSDASPADYELSVKNCLHDEGIDGILVIYVPFPGVDPGDIAEAVANAAEANPEIPLFTLWMGEEAVRNAMRLLNSKGIPTYFTPEQAVKSFIYMYRYDNNLKLLQETPEIILKDFVPDVEKAERIFRHPLSGERAMLHLDEVAEILEIYGIPTAKAKTMKVESEEDVVQRSDEDEYELSIGAKRSLSFGTVIVFGIGGKLLETMKDYSIGLPPLNQTLARRMMEETRIYQCIHSQNTYHSSLKKLEEILVRFSRLIIDFPEIDEIDINPVLFSGKEVTALDARILIAKSAPAEHKRRKGDLCPSHLSIPPYPSKYSRETAFKDGTSILIRPIRGEDEPIMYNLLKRLSDESVYARFCQLFRDMPHEKLVRFCQIDYDREMAFVAVKKSENGAEEIIGDVRISKFPDLENAELSILVADQWQGKGVGNILMDYCIGVAREVGLKMLWMEILKANVKMINFGFKYGFRQACDDGDMIKVVLHL